MFVSAASRHLLAAAVIAAAVGFVGAPAAHAQATSPASATQGSFSATITAIQGTVTYRDNSEAEWQIAKVGQVLNEGAELRTSVRSAVQFTIPPAQTITLDRLGVLQVLRSTFQDGKIVTDLGMKYGRTHYSIDAQGVEHDAKVHSPSSVLAIRGTDVILFDQPPFAPQAVSLTGRAMFRDIRKEIAFGGPGAGTSRVDEKSDTPANTALQQTVTDPRGKFTGRTETDQILQQSLAAYGGADFSDLGVLSFFAAARNGTFKGSFTGALPIGRQLAFNLVWTGGDSDVDLIITSPLGEVVSPTITSVPSGGQHLGNNISVDGTGQEQVVWPISYPVGTYTVRAELKRGGSVQADVFAIDDPLGIGQVIGNLTGALSPNNPVLQGTVTATGQNQQQAQSRTVTAAAKAAKPAKTQPAANPAAAKTPARQVSKAATVRR